MPVFSAKVSRSSVQTGDLSALLCPVASTLLLAGKRSLRTPQLRQFACKKTWVGKLFSVRSRCELSEPDVQSHRRKDVPNLFWLRNFARNYQEPLVGFTLQGERFDLSLDFAVQANSDRSYMLHAELVSFESDSVAVTREENRIEPISRFESRVTRFLTGSDAPKEISERFIISAA